MLDLDLLKMSLGYFMMAGMTIVIALAWNTAINALIETYFPNKNTTVVGLFTYALTITLISIVIFVNFIGKDRFSEIVLKNYPNIKRTI